MYEATVEIENKNNIRSLASNKETVPAAMGRYFFVGCNISMFLSDKSLKIYVTVVIKQNKKKIINASKYRFNLY